MIQAELLADRLPLRLHRCKLFRMLGGHYMKKKIGRVLCLLMAIALTVGLTSGLTVSAESIPEITVTVYANNYDEEYIESIELDDGTTVGDYEYSVEYITQKTRDPIYITYYFDFAGWITRDGVVSLSLDPADIVRSDSSLWLPAWNILKDPTYGVGRNSNWPTDSTQVQTLKWQYDCHCTFANDKDYWNLEPSRTAGSYLAVVLAACNP